MTLDLHRLSIIERHLLSEDYMEERITLPYNKAIEVFISCIQSNEILSLAYNNYEVYKDTQHNIENKETILVHTALDKFSAKLFFTIMNNRAISHIEFDNNTNTFTTIFENLHSYDKEKIFYQWTTNFREDIIAFNICGARFSDIWERAALIVRFRKQNPNSPNSNKTRYIVLKDQPFKNENAYRVVEKIFTPIYKIDEERNTINGFCLKSDHNPAHTTLFPNDIEAFREKIKFLKTKKANKE